jgi:glycerol transport system ATP-binding protein
MTVGENLAFPLTTRGSNRRRADIDARVKAVAEELNIEGILNRPANGISLFEKQLVAIGRALVRPDVSMVLLDEPLTAVEPSVKWRLRQTLKQAQKDLGVTMVYVTHDQTEALTFAERVAVLADGDILQTGSPEDVYRNPAHEFVGHFLGSPGMNFLPVAELPETLQQNVRRQGDPERLGFRPESAKLTAAGTFDLTGVVRSRRVLGTQQGDVISMYGLQCGAHSVFVRSSAAQAVGDSVSIDLRHWVGFRDGIRVGRHGAE